MQPGWCQPVRQEFMENECEALPGVAYPGVQDNRSTINTKTGYDDDDKGLNQLRADQLETSISSGPTLAMSMPLTSHLFLPSGVCGEMKLVCHLTRFSSSRKKATSHGLLSRLAKQMNVWRSSMLSSSTAAINDMPCTCTHQITIKTQNSLTQAVWPPGSADTICPRPPLTLTFDLETGMRVASKVGRV